MMATVLQQTEGVPESYPATGLSPEPANASLCWQRIEAYIAHRWTPRTVLWVVQGPGEFVPPLTPATIADVSVWGFGGYESVDLDSSPLGGFVLPGVGPYQFIATVGDDDQDVPAAVLEAVIRLSDYLTAAQHRPGIRSVTAGGVSATYGGDEAAAAQALQRSGAADLLRRFRRAT